MKFLNLNLLVFKFYSLSSYKRNNVVYPLFGLKLTITWTIDQLNLDTRSFNWKCAESFSLSLLKRKILPMVASFLSFSDLKLSVIFFIKNVYEVLDKT